MASEPRHEPYYDKLHDEPLYSPDTKKYHALLALAETQPATAEEIHPHIPEERRPVAYGERTPDGLTPYLHAFNVEGIAHRKKRRIEGETDPYEYWLSERGERELELQGDADRIADCDRMGAGSGDVPLSKRREALQAQRRRNRERQAERVTEQLEREAEEAFAEQAEEADETDEESGETPIEVDTVEELNETLSDLYERLSWAHERLELYIEAEQEDEEPEPDSAAEEAGPFARIHEELDELAAQGYGVYELHSRVDYGGSIRKIELTAKAADKCDGIPGDDE